MANEIKYVGPSGGGGGGAIVKSVQRGVTPMYSNGVLTKDITITAVDLANSIVVVKGQLGQHTQSTVANKLKLKNSTTLNFERYAKNTSVYISWEVVEYEGAIVQEGEISGTTSSGNSAINAVDLNKAQLFGSLKYNTGLQSEGARYELSSPTNVLLTLQGGGDAWVFQYYVVEIGG